MDKHFTLTSREGIYAAGSNRPTIIGQTEGCDLLLPNNSPYENRSFAKFDANADGSGWHIVRLDRFADISVNGLKLNCVHYLSDGDSIDIEGHHYRFNVREGEQRAPEVTHVHRGGKMLWGIVALLLLVAASVAYLFWDNNSRTLTDGMRAEVEQSVFLLQVDSLQLLKGDSIIDRYAYASAPTGTAFLSTDSLLVTARHCLQPWLNVVLPADYATLPTVQDWPVRSALLAETNNQLDGTDEWRIRSFATLTDSEGNTLTVNSDDFTIPTELDEIVELGSYSDPQFWRSISHRYSRRDMMLDDVAVMHFGRPGQIPLASGREVRKLLHPGVKLTFVGHPESSVVSNALDFQVDELHHPLREYEELPGRLFMLGHDGALIHGFSGGPVLVRDGLGFKAVGIISVVDERNKNRSYSVPISEIELLK